MKKYIFSAFLALALLACLLPCVALQAGAEESETTFVKVEPTALTAGTYLISGTSAVALDDGADTLFMTTENCEDNRLMGAQLTLDGDRVTTGDNECMWELVEAQDGFYIKSVAKGTYLYWNEDKGGNAIYQTETVDEASVWQVIRHENSHTDGTVTTDYTLVQADGRGLSCNRFGSERNRYLGFAAYDLETTSCLCSLTFYKAAESEVTYIAQGTCGDNLTWTLTDDGILTISGTGAMWSYYSYFAPWHAYREDVTTVIIENGATSIGECAFQDCSSLVSVTIGDSVTSIGSYAFEYCSSLVSVTIGDGVTSIGSYAFEYCSSLESVTVGDSVTSIGSYAFEYCSSLESVTIPDSVTSIGYAAFYDCWNLWHVLYKGTEEDWNAISIGLSNTKLTSATRHYECIGDEISAEITVAPTCTESGTMTHTCSVCQKSKDVTLDALGHSWKNATCTDPKTCTNCGATEGEALAGEHNWDEGQITSQPTCVEDGYKTYTCTLCGDTRVEVYAAAFGHSFGDWFVADEATCTADGLRQRDCVNCDLSETEAIAATGHSYESMVIEPTCEEAGYTLYTCGNCGDSYGEDYAEALGHNYEYAEIAPTCTRQGYTLRTCANCADSYIDNFTAATGHSYTTEVVAATCTQVGYTISTCDLCGHSEISDFVDAIGHEMSNWIAVLSPTCTEVGAEQRHCAYCEYSEVRETAATGHSYEARVIAATCTDMGFTIHTCHCGDGYVDTFTEVTDHSYVDGVCEHCGESDPDAVLMGDANGDGVVNYLDAMLIAQYYVGDIEEDGLNLDAADVNGDGVVNYLDAMMVAQFYVGDIDEFPA